MFSRSVPVLIILILICGSLVLADTQKTPDQYFLLGNAYYSMGDAVNATQMYKEAVSLNPNLSDAWNNLGIVLTNQEKYPEALEALDNASRINATNPDTWYNKGVTLGMLSRYDEELAAYQTAISLEPNLTAAWRNIGVNNYEQKKYDEAIRAFEKAVSLDPKSAMAWYFLGTAYEKVGNITGAESSYKSALKLDQNMTQAQKKISELQENTSVPSKNTGDESVVPDRKKTPFPVAPVLIALIGSGFICWFMRSE